MNTLNRVNMSPPFDTECSSCDLNMGVEECESCNAVVCGSPSCVDSAGNCYGCAIHGQSQSRPLRREAPRDYGMSDPYFEQEVLDWFSTMTPDKAVFHLNRITRVLVNNASFNRGVEGRCASSSSSSQSIINSDGRLGSLSREHIGGQIPLIRQQTLVSSEKENIHPNITVRVPRVSAMDVDYETNDDEMDISELI
tara:strand:- start:358 stop:945 length:588 start_codon:yes stop_codon:yes gene_type:complete